MYRPVKNSSELVVELKALKRVWSNESIVTTRAIVYLCELMEKLLARQKRKRRPLTTWQRAVSMGLKQGRTMNQVSADYRTGKA